MADDLGLVNVGVIGPGRCFDRTRQELGIDVNVENVEKKSTRCLRRFLLLSQTCLEEFQGLIE